MAKVDLKGVAKVVAKGRTYFYAWRGGPRLKGRPGSPEFIASYAEALASRKTRADGTVRALVANYRSSAAYKDLAESTRKIWARWLDRIVERFGEFACLIIQPKFVRLSGSGGTDGRTNLGARIMRSKCCPG